MAAVTFLSPTLAEPVVVRLPDAEGVSLLALARAYEVPLRCECGEGRCGACAVKVAPCGAQTGTARLTLRERGVLYEAGKLPPEDMVSAELPDHPPRWRLACQYLVGGENIVVAF